MSGQRPLSEKQERFCQEYLIDLNASSAYKRAGYTCRNDNVAAASASALLRNPNVAVRVEQLLAERAQRVGMTADEVLRETRIVGRSSAWDYEVDDNGNLTLAPGVPEEQKRAIASV